MNFQRVQFPGIRVFREVGTQDNRSAPPSIHSFWKNHSFTCGIVSFLLVIEELRRAQIRLEEGINGRPGLGLDLKDVDPDLIKELLNARQTTEVWDVDASDGVARVHQAAALPHHVGPLHRIGVLVDQVRGGCECQVG